MSSVAQRIQQGKQQRVQSEPQASQRSGAVLQAVVRAQALEAGSAAFASHLASREVTERRKIAAQALHKAQRAADKVKDASESARLAAEAAARKAAIASTSLALMTRATREPAAGSRSLHLQGTCSSHQGDLEEVEHEEDAMAAMHREYRGEYRESD